MEPIYDGIARRARASLGVSSFGMQVMTLPPEWDGYPLHRHDADVDDAQPGGGLHPAQGLCRTRRGRGAPRASPRHDGPRGARPAAPDPARAGGSAVHRARRRARVLRRVAVDRARRAASGAAVLGVTVDNGDLAVAARAGDERAFVELTSPYRAALHAHCYRLLGSLHDADDALQETLLRAWRSIGRFEPRAPVAAWLYRIATNVCLRMIEQRRLRPAPIAAHLEPYPDAPLGRHAGGLEAPAEAVETREAIGLAFV